MKTFKSILFLLALLSFVSCSVEKRHYMSGYNINFKNNQPTKIANVKAITSETSESYEYPVTSCEDNTIYLASKSKSIKNLTDTCDLIELKNKTTIYANIKSIDSKTIIYDDCNSLRIKEHTINKSEITKITFKNGTIRNYYDDVCDIIELNDKSTKKVKVIFVGVDKIEYKKCDNLEGPNEIINKSNVNKIAYADGHIEKIEQPKKYVEPSKEGNGMNDSAFYEAKKIVAVKNGKYKQNGFELNQLLFWRILEKSENPEIKRLLKESKKQTTRKQLGILIIPLCILLINFPLAAIMVLPITWLGLISCEVIFALAIIFFAILSHRGKNKKRIVDSEAVKLYNDSLLK